MSYQKKSIAGVTLAIMVGVLAGCSATPVSQQGARVEITTERPNGCKMLGDIVISMERAQEQATLYGHPLQREVAFLTVHSMLHLLGYDHENGGLEAMRMREKEEAVLIQLGLPRTVSYTE